MSWLLQYVPSFRRRVRRVPAVLLLLGGLGCVTVGLGRETVSCTRATDSCAITRGLPLLARTRTLARADLRGHEFVDDEGSSRLGHIALRDAEDRPLLVGAGPEVEARARYDRLVACLTGPDAVAWSSGPSLPLLALGLALILASPLPYHVPVLWPGLEARLAKLEGEAAPAPAPPFPAPRVPTRMLVVAVALLAALAWLSWRYTPRTGGTLELDCRRRCEVAGRTCDAGQTLTLTLTPGEHEVRVFTPDAGPWATRRVTIAQGGATAFTCAE